jgi:hypothetical protein
MAKIKKALEERGHVVTELTPRSPPVQVSGNGGTVEDFGEQAEGVPAHADDDAFWGDEDKPAPIPVTAPTPKPQTAEYVPPVAKSIPEAAKKKEPAAAPDPVPAKIVTRADILEAMGGKKMRLNDLAKKLGVDVPYLAGTFLRNGFETLTAGWVRDTIQITED